MAAETSSSTTVNWRELVPARGRPARGCTLNVTCTGGPVPLVCAVAQTESFRRVQLLFSSSLHWKDYDVFKRAKDTAFRLSQAAVHELAARYRDVLGAVSQTAGSNDSRGHLLFEEMTLIALWGNATDLSLLTKLSLEDIQGLQGAEAIRRNMRNIVSNDEELTWQYLVGGQPHKRVDIVLDNSGFEFVTDLIYGSYLLKSGFANHVVLHTKSFPWFVSDVTPRDVETTLRDMENPAIFPDRGALDYVVGMIRSHLKSGQMTVESHDFWTTACSFHELPAEAPDLYAYLQRSNLVVFKGDLNYRKLTNDALWPYTTPFKTALGPMGDGSGVKILALRTNKADVCVGLADEDMVKRLEEEAPGQAWTRNGKYAVISFSDGL